jgi:outer membrane protein OmpA-like peptidoglycan-associated protein
MRSISKIQTGMAFGALFAIGACASNGQKPLKLAPAAQAAAPSCADFSFPIYFEKGSDQLTAAARAVLDSSAALARACTIGKVEVLGLADADGPANRNLALSRRRATHVAGALAADGLPAPVFDIEAIGEAGAKAVDGKPEPLRRRTEVVIHALPKT